MLAILSRLVSCFVLARLQIRKKKSAVSYQDLPLEVAFVSSEMPMEEAYVVVRWPFFKLTKWALNVQRDCFTSKVHDKNTVKTSKFNLSDKLARPHKKHQMFTYDASKRLWTWRFPRQSHFASCCSTAAVTWSAATATWCGRWPGTTRATSAGSGTREREIQ